MRKIEKIFDMLVEAACWLGIAVILWVIFDVTKAEVDFNRTVQNIPPITVKGD